MLVDNPLQPSFFAPSSSMVPSDFTNDLDQFLTTELFGISSKTSTAGSSSSRASSPQSPFQSLLTPPQSNVATSFPDINDPSSFSYNTFNNTFFNFLEDDMKLSEPIVPASSTPCDFYGNFSGGGGGSTSVPVSVDVGTDSLRASPVSSSSVTSSMGINPQAVSTPSATSGVEEEEEEQEEKETEKFTVTIQPVKVAGHGKARRGTIQGGGITKKVSSPPALSPPATSTFVSRDKENLSRHSSGDSFKEIDDDDDLPADWRPPPEVFQKMSSKEKRQLRNKISARNFRVRRKEYISTLEMDVAERDRLIQAIRTELGAMQSENGALRQEVDALKKALLEGRSGQLTSDDIPILNLPPPAPLSSFGSSPTPSTSSPSNSNLIIPNTHKDLPTNTTSPRLNAFWGGVSGGIGLGSGFTSVHTAIIPEVFQASNVRSALQDNINPTLNVTQNQSTTQGNGVGGFDGFVDMNPFTMKTLDAYRMQLWTKMASQQAQSKNNYRSPSPPPIVGSPSPFTQPSPPFLSGGSPQLHGLAASLRQLNFTANKQLPTPPASPSLGSLLAGKQSLSSKQPLHLSSVTNANKERVEHAMLAAYASHSMLGKLSGAFWDAFSGHSSSSSPLSAKNWDAEKVRKVLEGKAVVKVVDVEPSKPKVSRPSRVSKESTVSLEECMKSLTLSKN